MSGLFENNAREGWGTWKQIPLRGRSRS